MSTRWLLTFASRDPHPLVPYDYPRRVHAWVFRVLAATRPDLAAAWHDPALHGPRPFAAPGLDWSGARRTPQGLRPARPWTTGLWGCPDPDAAAAFAAGALHLPLDLGGVLWDVADAVPLALPDHAPAALRLLSPLLVALPTPRGRVWISLRHPRFLPLVRQNLSRKAGGVPVDAIRLTLPLPDAWRSVSLAHPRFAAAGWTTRTPLVLDAPPAVLAAAATLGLGVLNTHGFGAVHALDPAAFWEAMPA